MTTVSGALDWPARRTTSGTWLISRSADFWLACAGGGLLLAAMAVVLRWHGDRELDTADLLLSELHLGATYDAIIRGRLWRRMPLDVVAVPLAIVAPTYALMFGGYSLVVATAALYLAPGTAAVRTSGWRGTTRRGWAGRSPHGTAVSSRRRSTRRWSRAWSTSPARHRCTRERIRRTRARSRRALRTRRVRAATCVAAYLAFVFRHRDGIHPGERWLVTAQALSFGSAYVLGAWSVSFILVLVVHHEVQYLYFTYAMARRSAGPRIAHAPARSACLRRSRSGRCWGWELGPLPAVRVRMAAAFLVSGLMLSLLARRPHLDGACAPPGRRLTGAGTSGTAIGIC